MLKGKKAVSEIEEFENLIKKKPDDDRAYVRLAELYARNGNEDRAIEIYEKAALVFEKKGFLNKAKAVLKQALMLNPDHGKINVLLADYDRQGGLIKDALMRYQIAVSYYAKIGNKLAAINILRKIVELNPNNFNFVLKLSSLLVEEKMFHEAEKLLVPLAGELKGTAKVNEYAATLKLLYAATNNDSEIGKDLVNLYLRNASYPNALIVLQKLIMEDPESIEFLEKLAFVFEKLNEKQKLVATYKQIGVILSKRQSFAERDDIYRKILELDPHDREALSALKEEGKLRSIITDKIEGSSNELTDEEDEDAVDLVIDVDIDIDNEPLKEAPRQGLDIETALKEAKVFMSYSLYSKALDRIYSCPDWESSHEALDILIQANIETGEMNRAGDLMIVLADLFISEGKLEESFEILSDAESIIGEDDQRIVERKKMFSSDDNATTLNNEFSEDEQVFDETPGEMEETESVEETEGDEAPVEQEQVEEEYDSPEADLLEQDDAESKIEEKDFLSDITSGSLLAGDEEHESDQSASFESLASDILSELLEPPQNQLDELEFYISIEDFSSATQLLQELLINYPQSRFLAGIREIIPIGKEEDLAGTMNEVRGAETDFLGENPDSDQLYDMAISNLTMGMFTEAVSLLDRALEQDPENLKLMMGLSMAWEEAGHLEKSIEILEKAVKVTKDKEQTMEIVKLLKEKKDALKSK